MLNVNELLPFEVLCMSGRVPKLPPKLRCSRWNRDGERGVIHVQPGAWKSAETTTCSTLHRVVLWTSTVGRTADATTGLQFSSEITEEFNRSLSLLRAAASHPRCHVAVTSSFCFLSSFLIAAATTEMSAGKVLCLRGL